MTSINLLQKPQKKPERFSSMQSQARYNLHFFRQIFSPVLETCELAQKPQRHGSDRPIALLGDDQVREALQILAILSIKIFTIDERHHIRILLARARISKIASLRLI